jgi:hypothetical protein
MRSEDFDRIEACQICKEDTASVYAVISCGWFVCKAHVCFSCFGELEECGGKCVESVSFQEFKEMTETPTWSECSVDKAEPKVRGRQDRFRVTSGE